MAAEFRESIPGILLMTPHAGLAEVAADHYPFFPVRWMVKDPFPSKEWLRTYVGREVMVVCLEDEVIPPRFGRELFEYAVGPKTLIEIPDCGHNTWPLHRGAEWFAQAWNFLCQSKASNHGPHFPSLKN
jgi:pimeloyl-ACP methyl ester carboxylesterase